MNEQTNEKPPAVEYEPAGEWTTVLIRTDIEKHGDGTDGYYTANLHRIIVRTATLTPETRTEIETDPKRYAQMIEVDDVKPEAEQKVQKWIDAATTRTATIPCDGFPGGIVYNTQACINAMGLEEGDAFIDAGNRCAPLTADQVQTIKRALKQYVAGLYATATAWRTRISNATTRAELDAIMQEIEL